LKNQLASRRAALGKLQRVFDAVAEFQWAQLDRKPPVACWLYFKVRSARLWTEPDDHPRDGQDCICSYYLLAGRLPNGSRLSTGNWGIDYTWHAVARLLEPTRSPLALTAPK